MRKIQIVVLALLAVFAFSAFVASSAFATSKVLIGGAEISKETNAEIEGELLLEDMKATGPPDLLCSGFFDVVIHIPGTEMLIVEVLMLDRKPLLANGTEGTPGVRIDECTDMKSVCSSAAVEALNLPWTVDVELIEGSYVGLILNAAEKEPAYGSDCNTILGLVEDTCKGATGAILTNEATDISAEFSETNEKITEPGSCSIGGAKEGLLQGVGLFTSSEGTLSLSE